MAIKNLVFDIGNVLLRWEPEKNYNTLFNRKDFYDHPLSQIIGGPVWLNKKGMNPSLELESVINNIS